ncbi:S-adenosyl-L-methionine-dependent methyltransferase [Coemansia spiralis]|nr:S-adenosyl-L-methionine-dependent methyltransferase [Coemansia spiralis]
MDHSDTKKSIVCLEFFSGIGGLHYGLQESGIHGHVVMSFDMNENANSVYEYNFKMRPNNKAIDYLEPVDIDTYQATCWLLSPPCQPYTRGGKYLDDEDPRARGLIHLLGLLPKLKHKPTHLLLENVMNFENSRSRSLLVETLGNMGFKIYECLLSPVQAGIPNNRLRYYLVAVKTDDTTNAAVANECKRRTEEYLQRAADQLSAVAKDTATIPLESYIDHTFDGVASLYVSAADIVKRKNFEFDIVQPSSERTSTFTKAYGSKHLIGAGSLLQTKHMDVRENGFGAPEKLLDLGLRFFSPKEVALLHHFPLGSQTNKPYVLEFPENLTQRQQLQLLGNSLNVHMVALLIKHVLFTN